MSKEVALVWFRQDLRLSDNPSLVKAAQAGLVMPIYILDEVNAGDYAMGGASKVWLHHSLCSLNQSLDNQLAIFQGDATEILLTLIKQHDIKTVFWNRCYEPWRIARDKQIKQHIRALDVKVETSNASLLWEPWENLKADNTPYKVFTPYYKAGCKQENALTKPSIKPRNLLVTTKPKASLSIDALDLLEKRSWSQSILNDWQVGEEAAKKRLQQFIKTGLSDYKNGRDFPAMHTVSRLSPHLHFGEISPRQIWFTIKKCQQNSDTEHFLRELCWREFSYNLLYHFPKLPFDNLQPRFDRFPWRKNQRYLQCWQQGQTGYPIIDAGMRELWQTGYMHNRVRMIVGSFLVKNLLQDWRAGEAWFWDCLLDADLANNSASWQWVAGCGADAAPYFRVFNPVTQSLKFDPEGDYIRQYVPELTHLPPPYLFSPWEAPDAVLQEAGVVLGRDYPKPIVDLKASRQQALDAYEKIRG